LALEFPEETSTFGLQQRQNLHDTSDPTFQSALHLVRLGFLFVVFAEEKSVYILHVRHGSMLPL
jgi:hypothetical protein